MKKVRLNIHLMKRFLNIHIKFTNRFLYTFIAFAIILIIGVTVFALTPGVAPNPGHLIDNVAPPSQCSSGQVLQWGGSSWSCTDQSASAGDITEVRAGTGLSGGGASGSVTLKADTIYLQRRVSASCPAGTSIRVISASGAVTCEVDDGHSGVKNCQWINAPSTSSISCPTNKPLLTGIKQIYDNSCSCIWVKQIRCCTIS